MGFVRFALVENEIDMAKKGKRVRCDLCHGKGVFYKEAQAGFRTKVVKSICRKCMGSGKIVIYEKD